MMNEIIIHQGEEKYFIIKKHGQFWWKALCDTFIEKNNLYYHQLIGTLNGHVIVDTGIIKKTDNWTWETE